MPKGSVSETVAQLAAEFGINVWPDAQLPNLFYAAYQDAPTSTQQVGTSEAEALDAVFLLRNPSIPSITKERGKEDNIEVTKVSSRKQPPAPLDGSRGAGVQEAIREAVLVKRSASANEIYDTVTQRGHTTARASVANLRAGTLNTMKTLSMMPKKRRLQILKNFSLID